MSADAETPVRSRFIREIVWLVTLLLIGVLVLPIAIWFVGDVVFGDYEGGGYMDFFGALVGRLANGDGGTWFLVLSPYLAISALRLTAVGWRLAAGGSK